MSDVSEYRRVYRMRFGTIGGNKRFLEATASMLSNMIKRRYSADYINMLMPFLVAAIIGDMRNNSVDGMLRVKEHTDKEKLMVDMSAFEDSYESMITAMRDLNMSEEECVDRIQLFVDFAEGHALKFLEARCRNKNCLDVGANIQ